MLRSVYLKTVRDRWAAAVIAVGSLFLVAWMGLWAYAGMGDQATDFFDSMPEAYLSVLGITPDAGVAGMMMSNLFNFLGPFIIAGIGISMGAAVIAGEESAGTMNVLGTQARSRTRLLTSTSLAILTIVVVSATLATVSYLGAIAITGTDAGALDLVAATVHLLVVSVFYGAVALAIGAWTGNRVLASGVGVAFILLSFLGAGLLPLVDGLADWAKVFPWYYISGPQPMVDGVDWAPMAVLGAATAVLWLLGWWGLNRRDLGSGAVRTPLMDRLRADPRIGRAVSMLAGRGSSRGIASKALSDLRAVLVIACAAMIGMSLILGPMFNAISGDIGGLVEAMPDGVLAMVGYADFSTPEGWYYGEVLSIVGPVAVAVVAINAGAQLAGEERRRTIGVLLSVPVSRSSVAARKALAIATGSVLVGGATFVGIAGGNAIAGLGMDYGHIAAASVLLAGLGMLLGAVAFLAGAASGRHNVAVGAGTGVAILGWGINSFVPVNPDLADWARLSPFYYYSTPNPLVDGMTWWHLGLLVGVAALLVAVGVVAYRARDLRG